MLPQDAGIVDDRPAVAPSLFGVRTFVDEDQAPEIASLLTDKDIDMVMVDVFGKTAPLAARHTKLPRD
jgi:hypothetical protein